jgi:transcriptional regulator with XRE-family HTH domain
MAQAVLEHSDAGVRIMNSGSFTLTETVGDRIRWARERKEITQKELGRLIDKSRASIVQYEKGMISAPVAVLQDMADKLGVAPEFLAFGRTGLSGVRNAEEEIETFEEFTYGKGGGGVSGGWAIPRSVFSDTDSRDMRIVSLTADEPHFGMHRGDRIFVDTSSKIEKDGLYAIQSAFGSRIVRVRFGFSASSEVRLVSGSDGNEEKVDPSTLSVIGLVVASFTRLR